MIVAPSFIDPSSAAAEDYGSGGSGSLMRWAAERKVYNRTPAAAAVAAIATAQSTQSYTYAIRVSGYISSAA